MCHVKDERTDEEKVENGHTNGKALHSAFKTGLPGLDMSDYEGLSPDMKAIWISMAALGTELQSHDKKLELLKLLFGAGGGTLLAAFEVKVPDAGSR